MEGKVEAPVRPRTDSNNIRYPATAERVGQLPVDIGAGLANLGMTEDQGIILRQYKVDLYETFSRFSPDAHDKLDSVAKQYREGLIKEEAECRVDDKNVMKVKWQLFYQALTVTQARCLDVAYDRTPAHVRYCGGLKDEYDQSLTLLSEDLSLETVLNQRHEVEDLAALFSDHKSNIQAYLTKRHIDDLPIFRSVVDDSPALRARLEQKEKELIHQQAYSAMEVQQQRESVENRSKSYTGLHLRDSARSAASAASNLFGKNKHGDNNKTTDPK